MSKFIVEWRASTPSRFTAPFFLLAFVTVWVVGPPLLELSSVHPLPEILESRGTGPQGRDALHLAPGLALRVSAYDVRCDPEAERRGIPALPPLA